MGLSFIRPFMLIFIPVLIVGIVYSMRWLKRVQKNKIIFITLLRAVVVSLLVLAISGASVFWKVDNITTLFLIDGSDSTSASRNSMEAFIREADKYKGSKDKTGVISFGNNTQVESFVSKDSTFSKIEGKINSNYTNIENAMSTALSLFPDNSNKRIVLLSDGEENSGAVSKIITSLQQQDISLKYYKVQKTIGDEVAMDSISIPSKLNYGEEFNVSVAINSTTAEEANIVLYCGRAKVGEQKVQLQKGINKFIFRDKAYSGGFRSYKAVIEPSKDTEIKNNEASTFTNVMAKPKVLVLQDSEGEADNLIKILKASSLDYTLLEAASAPRTLQEMSTYKAIITCNVSADNLNEGFLNSIESYVKDFGGGFVATGGDNSFALGGYTKTSLEKVLPVYMDMKGKKEIPKMAMVLIIDKSGSMTEGMAGISKVDMAKEAAIRSLESLREGKDEIGVLAFDESYSWAVKEQVINNTKAIEDQIGTIRAEGGTSILPALQQGYNSLKNSDAKIKHIILLTDGQAEKTGYEDLINNINKDNITVSTVAVGNDADKDLLANIAKQCGGRTYITDQYTNIPRIFSKETFMAARNYLNNREFTPIITGANNILNGVAENGLPNLLGYVGASQKETARVVLKSDEDDPILTEWQYGLGKTVAWNSDISGKWSANYMSWDKNLKLWQNIINFTLENYDDSKVSINVEQQGEKANIVLQDKKNDEELNSSIAIVTPSGENIEQKLTPTAPGEYSGTMDLKETGVYMINAKEEKNGETVSAANTGFAVQYSPEYKINDSSNIDKLIASIGGKNITSPKEVFSEDVIHKKGMLDINPYLVSIALILFLIDIAMRRLNISLYKVRNMFIKTHPATKTFHSNSLINKLNNKALSKRTYEETITEKIEDAEKLLKVEDDSLKNNELENQEKPTLNSLDTSKLLKNKKFKK